MSVYVDETFRMESKNPEAFRVGARHGHRWCHLFADTLAELHAMARRLKLKREWFQEDGSLPHYDLTPTVRARAVALGAKELDRRDAVAVWERIREQARGVAARPPPPAQLDLL